MPAQRPFLTEPAAEGQVTNSAVPDALFDLAVNRAWAALHGPTRIGQTRADQTRAVLPAGERSSWASPTTREWSGLAQWHARTRFARRVPLEAVRAALAQRPEGHELHWSGGPAGGWQAGKAPFP